MEIFFNEEYTTLWTAISSIMGVIATTMAIFALLYSMRTYRKTMQVVHYGEIDKMYFEILKEALDGFHVAFMVEFHMINRANHLALLSLHLRHR